MAVVLAYLQIQVTLENIGEKAVLIPVGMTLGKPHPTSLGIHLKLPDGATPTVIYTGIGFVAGYAEPMTVALDAGTSHTISTLVSLYSVLDVSQKLTTFIKHPCQLWVELDVKERECPEPLPSTLDSIQRTFPCWHGKVVSNVLQLPN